MENFCKFFFDIVTTYNDEICYVKHVLDPLCVFFTLFGLGGGGTKGCRAHNLLMQFSGLGSSKMSYVKHVLAPLPSSRCLAEGNRIFLYPRPSRGTPRKKDYHPLELFFFARRICMQPSLCYIVCHKENLLHLAEGEKMGFITNG